MRPRRPVVYSPTNTSLSLSRNDFRCGMAAWRSASGCVSSVAWNCRSRSRCWSLSFRGISTKICTSSSPVRVLLLDIVPKDGANRNAIAEGAVARALKTDPAPFMSASAAKLIETGNIDDHLARVAECDWIVEVVVERLDIKQALYRKLEAVRKPGTAISSNTSTIPLATLIEGLPESFARDFMITHFFNPPRYMRLMELVTGPATDTKLAEQIGLFCDVVMGKSVVRCKDSPGFIANRLGVFWMTGAVTETIECGLTIEEADAIMGRPFGVPKTGVFGLMDLVGLDLMPHVNASMAGALPKDDEFHAINRDIPVIAKLIADGYTGRKGKGGFYRLNKASGKRLKETLDLATGEFRAEHRAELPEIAAAGKDLRKLMTAPGKVGDYAWKVMGHTLAYAAKLIPEATDEIVAIDEAMRLGYNWKWGPFELIDMVGTDWLIERLRADKFVVAPMLERAAGRTFYRVENGVRQQLGQDGAYHDIVRPDGVLMLEDIKRASKPVLKNGSASVWDIGDGVLCFEFTSKSNSLDEQRFALAEFLAHEGELRRAVEAGEGFGMEADGAARHRRAIGPDRVDRVRLHRHERAAALFDGGLQLVDGARRVQPGIEAELFARLEMLADPGFRRMVDERLGRERTDVDLLADLHGVAPVDEDRRRLPQDQGDPRRAGEAGEPGEPLGAGRHIFALMLVGAGHDEAVEAAALQLGPKRRKPAGPCRWIGGLGEGLQAGFEHGGASDGGCLRA